MSSMTTYSLRGQRFGKIPADLDADDHSLTTRCLTHGKDKIVFEYSLDNRSESNTSVQGHSGGVPTNPKLLSNVQMPDGWTDYIYHVESASDHTSVSDVGPVASGFGVRQRTRFFTAVDPVNIPLLAP